MMKEEALKKSTQYYPQENEEYWKQHQSGFLASGLSRKKYCHKHGVHYNRFNYWFKKLLPHQGVAPSSEKELPEKNNLLLPVHLRHTKGETLSTSLCTLNLKNGHSLIIHHERALSLLLEQWR
jgi:hypothetical protein